jgi:hypothetical protein
VPILNIENVLDNVVSSLCTAHSRLIGNEKLATAFEKSTEVRV